MPNRIHLETSAKGITAHLCEQDTSNMMFPLPSGRHLPVGRMSIEDFLDACEMCLRGLTKERQEVCRQLLYEGRIPFPDKQVTCEIDLTDLLHRWYVLEELCRLGVKLPEQAA